jgi:hypothetical protein
MAPSAFHLFPLLPRELRLEIWTWTLPRGRSLKPHLRTEGQKVRFETGIMPLIVSKGFLKDHAERSPKSDFLSALDPAIFNVCMEARAVVWSYYAYRPTFGQWNDTNFVDWENDILVISTETLEEMFDEGGLVEQWDVERTWEGQGRGPDDVGMGGTKSDIERLRGLRILCTLPRGSVDKYVELVMGFLSRAKGLRQLTVIVLRSARRLGISWSATSIKEKLSIKMEEAGVGEWDGASLKGLETEFMEVARW